jgi:hypothetical protein
VRERLGDLPSRQAVIDRSVLAAAGLTLHGSDDLRPSPQSICHLRRQPARHLHVESVGDRWLCLQSF